MELQQRLKRSMPPAFKIRELCDIREISRPEPPHHRELIGISIFHERVNIKKFFTDSPILTRFPVFAICLANDRSQLPRPQAEVSLLVNAEGF
jgi:hypothetical protein